MTFSVAPAIAAPLSPEFRPACLANRAYRAVVARTGAGVPVAMALERERGRVAVYRTAVLPDGHPESIHDFDYVERILKFLLWQKGAWNVRVAGPNALVRRLAAAYGPGGERAFDAEFFARIYEQPRFVVSACSHDELPPEREEATAVGGHLDGCRIGFDAGGSDRKVAALIDGKEVFSTETVWHPKTENDPQYHIDGIDDSIRRAAQHLPRIDAIGVSSAGIYVDNRTMVASLFRKVPEPLFHAKIKSIYLDLAKRWGVPIEVANDGDVTALAGALELGDHPVLGIAMGTSEAVGYVNRAGLITGWINELAFAPVDVSPDAPIDVEWSADRGTGVNYFSQDAVIRLASRAGIALDPSAAPGDKLRAVQELAQRGDPRPRGIYESIGVFLGYGLIHYADFYDLKHVVLLGRVTSGDGGAQIVATAKRVIELEAPELAARLRLHLPDESTRRVGQSIAAASLPRIR